ncbi:hypothetical protein [Cupriavidus sp. D39]|uniref:hypothetical protein n=1 Tax=Cupriavidus sp. D39 TaxID=2997877 RepID=UPI002271724A|nr:hypothetical protein [Cupriavidus sp. D39]MCY0855141.1 hypothetical protein [Cupriavidus sp. D39]
MMPWPANRIPMRYCRGYLPPDGLTAALGAHAGLRVAEGPDSGASGVFGGGVQSSAGVRTAVRIGIRYLFRRGYRRFRARGT